MNQKGKAPEKGQTLGTVVVVTSGKGGVGKTTTSAAFAAGLVGSKALGEYLDRLGGAFALVFAMTAACALLLLVALLVATAMAAA